MIKKIIQKKKAAETFLQGVGQKLAGRSFIDNTTNPEWVVNKRKEKVRSDAQYAKFIADAKKRGYVR